jgi:ADP-heptose:LPS heptosyltransferase
MKPRLIKLLDFYIGKPLCFLLTILLLFKRIFDKKNIQQPKKILFLKLIEQGATVLAYPAIKNAVDKLGKENVYFCVFSSNRPIMDILNLIPSENIIEIRHNNLFSFMGDIFKLAVLCREKLIDSVIDMELFSRSSALISVITGARNRVGYHRFTSELPYRGNLMTHRVLYNPYLHVALAYKILVRAAFVQNIDEPLLKEFAVAEDIGLPEYIPPQADIVKVESAINKQTDRTYIILNPNASDLIPLRKWDIKNFIELVKLIQQKFPSCTIIITGTEEERKYASEIIDSVGREQIIDLTGKTSFNELMALYTICDVLITNDSGPGHFSTLTNIHKIILFGPETPVLYGPLGDRVTVIYKKLACSPCVNAMNHRFSPCRNNVCMQRITTGEVFEALSLILQNDKTQ